MTDSEKIVAIKEYLGISYNKLAASLGFEHAQRLYALRDGKFLLTRGVANLIHERYPEFSLMWLLTGEGDMLENNGSKDKAKEQCTPTYSELVSMLNEQTAQINRLLDIIEHVTGKQKQTREI